MDIELDKYLILILRSHKPLTFLQIWRKLDQYHHKYFTNNDVRTRLDLLIQKNQVKKIKRDWAYGHKIPDYYILLESNDL